MNTPTLPSFISTPRSRTRTSKQQKLLRQQRRADFFLTLYSCGLVAFLVHLAIS
jgi:hypothetical protein